MRWLRQRVRCLFKQHCYRYRGWLMLGGFDWYECDVCHKVDLRK